MQTRHGSSDLFVRRSPTVPALPCAAPQAHQQGTQGDPSMTATNPVNSLSFVSPTANSPWGTYLSQVDRVIPYLGHLARWAETLKRPKRALIVDIPIEMDDGSVRHYEGFRVQHNLSRGPGKGGVRYHPAVTLEEVM